jgi:hypothetical protein
MAFLRERAPRTTEGLLQLLEQEDADRGAPSSSSGAERRRTERILLRAWAAQRLGEEGRRSARLIEALERQVPRRSLHRDWMYHGLDGAAAVRALAALHSLDSVPVLVEAFRRVDPELKQVVNPQFGPYPLAWTDFRTKMYIIPALGELRSPEAKAFLQEYLAMPESAARELAPLAYDEATKALFRQDLSQAEIEALLRHPNGTVRGTALLECLDRPTGRRSAALGKAASWALGLPRARR